LLRRLNVKEPLNNPHAVASRKIFVGIEAR
jgi:hypothetical protein